MSSPVVVTIKLKTNLPALNALPIRATTINLHLDSGGSEYKYLLIEDTERYPTMDIDFHSELSQKEFVSALFTFFVDHNNPNMLSIANSNVYLACANDLYSLVTYISHSIGLISTYRIEDSLLPKDQDFRFFKATFYNGVV